jgi:phage N-6-adenine-methyltransferase
VSALPVPSLLSEHAEGLTEGLAQVLAGAALLADTMQDAGIPGALGLSPAEWAERRLTGRIRLTREERRLVVAANPEATTRELGEALGVDHKTVVNDRKALSGESSPSVDPEPAVEAENDDVFGESSPEAIEDAEVVEDDEAQEPLARAELAQPDWVKPPTRGQLSNQSGGTDEWATPQDFFDVVNAEFGFDLDVCALDSSAKCARYFTPETDGLAHDWKGTVWMNPPYGDVIADWMSKAHLSAREGATVVCLVPARTDTAWFHDHCFPFEVRFIRGRLRFGKAEASAPFPSCLVVLGPDVKKAAFDWSWR